MHQQNNSVPLLWRLIQKSYDHIITVHAWCRQIPLLVGASSLSVAVDDNNDDTEPAAQQ
jgi:hypothetical protein